MIEQTFRDVQPRLPFHPTLKCNLDRDSNLCHTNPIGPLCHHHHGLDNQNINLFFWWTPFKFIPSLSLSFTPTSLYISLPSLSLSLPLSISLVQKPIAVNLLRPPPRDFQEKTLFAFLFEASLVDFEVASFVQKWRLTQKDELSAFR